MNGRPSVKSGKTYVLLWLETLKILKEIVQRLRSHEHLLLIKVSPRSLHQITVWTKWEKKVFRNSVTHFWPHCFEIFTVECVLNLAPREFVLLYLILCGSRWIFEVLKTQQDAGNGNNMAKTCIIIGCPRWCSCFAHKWLFIILHDGYATSLGSAEVFSLYLWRRIF